MMANSRYQYTDDQLNTIFSVIELKMKEVRQHLDFAQNSTTEFTL